MRIYGIPLDVEITTGTLGDHEVIILEMKIQTVADDVPIDVQEATIVFTKEDAVNVAALIASAAAEEEPDAEPVLDS